MEKGHYGQYSGNARHSHKHHMVNSWEEEDVKRGRKLMAEGHKGHAEALFDDAHGSYNWDGHNSTGAEHHGMSRKSNRADRIRKRALRRSERSGAERGDEYDYEDPKVWKMLQKANKLDERSNKRLEGTHNMDEIGQEMMQRVGASMMAGYIPTNLAAGLKEASQEMLQEHGGGPRRMTGHGQSKGDQSATHTDYAHYKGTDPHYHGHDGESHGDQSATHRDYMVDPRTHNSPLHNTGWSGFNYNKAAAELDYMPIEHDMHRGMSRKKSKNELEKERDFVEERIKKQNAEAKDPNASPRQTKRLERINKQISQFDERKGVSRIASPLNAKGDKCPESGCVQEKGNGKWGVISGKTGKWWDANYDSRSSAEAGLRAYFASGGN